MVRMHRYERIWMGFGFAMLALFLAVITTAAIVDGMVPAEREPAHRPDARRTDARPSTIPACAGSATTSTKPITSPTSSRSASAKIAIPARLPRHLLRDDPRRRARILSIPLTGVNVMAVPGLGKLRSRTRSAIRGPFYSSATNTAVPVTSSWPRK